MGATLDLLPRMGYLEWLTVVVAEFFFGMGHGPVLFGVPLFLLLRDPFRLIPVDPGKTRLGMSNIRETLAPRSGRTSSQEESGARERTCRGYPPPLAATDDQDAQFASPAGSAQEIASGPPERRHLEISSQTSLSSSGRRVSA
jgi:hypothetical protein